MDFRYYYLEILLATADIFTRFDGKGSKNRGSRGGSASTLSLILEELSILSVKQENGRWIFELLLDWIMKISEQM
jgi:hypothetical protein